MSRGDLMPNQSPEPCAIGFDGSRARDANKIKMLNKKFVNSKNRLLFAQYPLSWTAVTSSNPITKKHFCKFVFFSIMIFCVSCKGDVTNLMDEFAQAGTPQLEIKAAINLNKAHQRLIIRFFDNKRKEVDVNRSISESGKVESVEITFNEKHIHKKILNTLTVSTLLSE
jgi:hypothetical protein